MFRLANARNKHHPRPFAGKDAADYGIPDFFRSRVALFLPSSKVYRGIVRKTSKRWFNAPPIHEQPVLREPAVTAFTIKWHNCDKFASILGCLQWLCLEYCWTPWWSSRTKLVDTLGGIYVCRCSTEHLDANSLRLLLRIRTFKRVK